MIFHFLRESSLYAIKTDRQFPASLLKNLYLLIEYAFAEAPKL